MRFIIGVAMLAVTIGHAMPASGPTAHHRHDHRDRPGRPGAAHAGRHGGNPERRAERRAHHRVERGRPVHHAGAAARPVHAEAGARGVRHLRAGRHPAAVRRGLQRRHHHAERRRAHPVHHRLCRQRGRADRQRREELGARRAGHRVAGRPRPRSAEPAADDAGRAGGPEHRLARRDQRRSGAQHRRPAAQHGDARRHDRQRRRHQRPRQHHQHRCDRRDQGRVERHGRRIRPQRRRADQLHVEVGHPRLPREPGVLQAPRCAQRDAADQQDQQPAQALLPLQHTDRHARRARLHPPPADRPARQDVLLLHARDVGKPGTAGRAHVDDADRARAAGGLLPDARHQRAADLHPRSAARRRLQSDHRRAGVLPRQHHPGRPVRCGRPGAPEPVSPAELHGPQRQSRPVQLPRSGYPRRHQAPRPAEGRLQRDRPRIG